MQILRLTPSQLLIHPTKNGRWLKGQEHDDLQSLIASIDRDGQRQPVEVSRAPNGKYELRTGFRRVAAIRALHKKGERGTPLILAVEIKADDAIAFRLNVEENTRRKALSPMDIAHDCQRFTTDFGKTQPEIASIFQKSQAWVCRHLQLLTFPPAVQMDIHLRKLSVGAAFELAGVRPEKRAETVARARKIAREKVESRGGGRKPGPGSAEVGAGAMRVAARSTDAYRTNHHRSLAEVRDAFQGMTGPAEEPLVREVSGTVVRFIDGEMTDEAFVEKWTGLLNG